MTTDIALKPGTDLVLRTTKAQTSTDLVPIAPRRYVRARTSFKVFAVVGMTASTAAVLFDTFGVHL